MANKRALSKGKIINPNYWVFCEGETEEAYVCFLRSTYRIPIEIVPKVVGNKITSRFIKNYKQNKPTHKKDKDFLIYDADVTATLEKLKAIKTAELIASNPSIELWFLLHYKNQQVVNFDSLKQQALPKGLDKEITKSSATTFERNHYAS